MRKKEKEIKDIGEIEAIIKQADYCHIGLVDGDEPYIVPVCFGYENNAIYFHGALEGRKVDLIKQNNKVCFAISADIENIRSDSACGWSTRFKSVMGTGSACILEGNEEKIHGLKVLLKHYSGDDLRLPQAKLDTTLVVRIDIEDISGKQSGY
jgi:nitroimidazol reductase NimA-like FMN-containing flavoprotein (pyridoxamine 5'-phosphate oxidase superfamily)